MSILKPFRAYRPSAGEARHIASFPYDVLSSDEARELARGNPLSFLHVGKPEIDLDPSIPLYDDRVYARARENLQGMIGAGTLRRDETPHLYVYQQRMGTHTQAGLVGLCSVAEYENDLIKKHEYTRRDKEDDRTRHVTECNANAEPVFLAYRARPGIDEIVDAVRRSEPACDFVADDGIAHAVWVVRDATHTARLMAQFADIAALYVADGHHRTAAAVRHGQMMRARTPRPTGGEPFEYFMAVVFPHDQLRILDYNRVVRDLNGLSPAAFLERLAAVFTVTPTEDPRPAAPGEFGLFLDGAWHRLVARPGTFPADDPVRSLDVSILQDNVLTPILGIADPRVDTRIDFVGGIRGMLELEKRCREGWAAAFALHPTSLDQLMNVSDAGQIMPPKSTWFEPKLRSGLLVRLIED